MLKGLVRCSSCGATLCQYSKGVSVQCHNYSRGICHTSHSIKIEYLEKAVIESLELSIAKEEFNLKPNASRPSDGTALGSDTDKLIAAEYRKLDRVKAAYENGIDTLEEYVENKKKIQAAIKKLESERPKQKNTFNKKAYSKKVSSVLKIINDPNQTPQAQNAALRTIIDSIIFNRPESSINIIFHT
jgi:hypothetical protein